MTSSVNPFGTPLSFRIVGTPVSKGSLTPFIQYDAEGKPHARLMEKKSGPARKALTEWRQDLARVFRMASKATPLFGTVRGRYLQPAAVSVQFFLQRPQSAPKYVEAPTTYPDLDKLERVVLDVLTAELITDDRQIVETHHSKVYAADDEPTGAIVRVWPCGPPAKEIWA